jgi:hypothetical protein
VSNVTVAKILMAAPRGGTEKPTAGAPDKWHSGFGREAQERLRLPVQPRFA